MSEDRLPWGGGAVARLLFLPPARLWPDGVVHHGSRAGILVLIAALLVVLFPPDSRLRVARYDVGTVASADVIAEIAFDVPRTPEELTRLRDEAAASVPVVFRTQPWAADSSRARVEAFLEGLESAARAEGASRRISRLFEDTGIPLSPSLAELLREPRVREEVAAAARVAMRTLLPTGVMDVSQPQFFTAGGVSVVGASGVERSVSRDSVLTPREFFARSAAFLPPSATAAQEEILRLILIRFQLPTLVLDPVRTAEARESARAAVPQVRARVLEGEAVVRANQQVGEDEVARLTAYYDEIRMRGGADGGGAGVLPVLGAFLLNVLILSIHGLLLFFYRPEIYTDLRWVLLQAFLILTYFVAGAWIAGGGLPTEVLPVAFATLPAAVLWDSRMALVLALTLGVLTGAQAPFVEFGILITTVIGAAAAALSVRVVRRRAQTWVFVALTASAYAVTVLSLGILLGDGWGPTLESAALAAAGAGVSILLAMGFIPLFEWFTGITTDQTLLEWADPNRPLLRRIALEAPGTYAHSVNVANLSEAAANAIGANGLLCRVGAYYHDLGKVIRPRFFVENQPGGRNPHERIRAVTSAAVVREHVTEGLRLAREGRLPRVIRDFIPEHHGTQKIQFFWDKALREEGGSPPNEEDFRYPGPRPRSRETAIAMLADAVESASRVLEDPTPERIRELIGGLVDARIRAGELDEAPLTMAEISRIREQFAIVLSGMHHRRIDYPSTRHLTRSAEAEPASGAEAEPGRVPEGEPA